MQKGMLYLHRHGNRGKMESGMQRSWTRMPMRGQRSILILQEVLQRKIGMTLILAMDILEMEILAMDIGSLWK